VITTTDSGGPNEFVVDGVNGYVCPPDALAIGEAIARLHANRAQARAFGEAGYERARTITWTGVIEKLVNGR
jgi:glycosyltransferase involved in cell wall biosynthesis